MKTLLTSLLLALLTTVGAQDTGVLRVEPAEVTKEVAVDNLEEDFEDVTSVMVTNNSGRTIKLTHELVRQRQPTAWEYRALDRLSRTTPYVVTAREQETGRPVTLVPGQTATFYVVLRPDGITGTGSTELRFADLNLPGAVLATARLTTTVGQRAATAGGERSGATSVRLYPNPATERFFVEAPRGTRISRVEVSNTLGRQIRAFNGPPGQEGYDIRTLPDGLYLISIYDANGKKLKTLRLLHRQFGA